MVPSPNGDVVAPTLDSHRTVDASMGVGADGEAIPPALPSLSGVLSPGTAFGTDDPMFPTLLSFEVGAPHVPVDVILVAVAIV